MNRTGGFASAKANPMDTLKTNTEKDLSLLNRHFRNYSAFAGHEVESKIGTSIAEFNVKPKLLESKISTRQDFAALSDGFKKIFSHDKKDQQMTIPISGYAGHKRGDRSQNFFGKSFRE